MTKTPRTWRCQRVRGGVKCATDNPRIKQKCVTCGGPRPKYKPPAHRQALQADTYDLFVAVFGEQCMLCGSKPKPGKKLHRDHGHAGKSYGKARGILCFPCNTALPDRVDAEWLFRAAIYMARAELPGKLNLAALI